ncbi:MAG: hypothetical protein ACYTGR_08885 [Planctomycetota bacterium]|jgi:hypothetical protein
MTHSAHTAIRAALVATFVITSTVGAGGGDCCTANGTPGCDDPTCQALICAADPFCCDTSWDQICANAAIDQCAVCAPDPCEDPDAGSCFQANGTPGCDNSTCCEIICLDDPFCCSTEWDAVCAAAAAQVCGNCGIPSGSCYQDNGSPGCDNADCCIEVCALDPICCEAGWDIICADHAIQLCSNCGGSGAGGCCNANGDPACGDTSCCAAVCLELPSCCETMWDEACAELAADLCGQCALTACCFPTDVCEDMTGFDCLFAGGSPVPQQTCSEVECGGGFTPGACCLPDGACQQVFDISICLTTGGEFQGLGSQCADVECPTPTECVGDVDGDNVVDVQDLVLVLTNWGECK